MLQQPVEPRFNTSRACPLPHNDEADHQFPNRRGYQISDCLSLFWVIPKSTELIEAGMFGVPCMQSKPPKPKPWGLAEAWTQMAPKQHQILRRIWKIVTSKLFSKPSESWTSGIDAIEKGTCLTPLKMVENSPWRLRADHKDPRRRESLSDLCCPWWLSCKARQN